MYKKTDLEKQQNLIAQKNQINNRITQAIKSGDTETAQEQSDLFEQVNFQLRRLESQMNPNHVMVDGVWYPLMGSGEVYCSDCGNWNDPTQMTCGKCDSYLK